MKVTKTKRARFSDVVKASGNPVSAVLWTPPEKDAAFSAALKQNRVMTLKEASTAARTDFGLIGFSPGKASRYLVFPKPLTAFNDKRIVGVKYGLVKTADPAGPPVKPGPHPNPRHSGQEKARPEKTVQAQPQPAPTVKRAKRFRVITRFTATVDKTQEFEAENLKEARGKAAGCAERPDFAAGQVAKRIIKVERVGAS